MLNFLKRTVVIVEDEVIFNITTSLGGTFPFNESDTACFIALVPLSVFKSDALTFLKV